MADEYIRKTDAVSKISDLLIFELHMTRCPTWNEVYNAIGELPSADVVQVVHSEWIYHMSYGVCKKCGYEYEWKGTDAKNYCPNCGAKMDKE